MNPYYRLLRKSIFSMLLLIGHHSYGSIIISNLSSTSTVGSNVSLGDVYQLGVAFTLPSGTDYQLGIIRLGLLHYQTPQDQLSISIHSDQSQAPGTLLAEYISPPSDNTNMGFFDFTPSSQYVLTGGGTYWIVLSDSADVVGWLLADVPSDGIAVAVANPARSSDGGSTWTPDTSNIHVSYQLEGISIPEPSAPALFGIFAVTTAFFRHRPKQNFPSTKARVQE